MTEIRHAVVRHARRPTSTPSTRSTRTRRAGSPSRSTCSTRASTSTASTAGFTAGGKQYYSGAALVDGASLATSGVNLATLATKRQTPVAGLNSYPAPRKQLTKPKIGLYTGAATIPSNPLFPEGPNVNGTSRHCALSSGGTAFCEALHSLAVKLEVPLSTLIPVTSADLAANKLVTDGFTAFINPGSTIATTTTTGTPPVTTITPTGTALQAFINGGGNYVGTNAGGATAARTIGATTLNTNTHHGPAHAGLDVRRVVRHDPTRSPGASTSAAGSTATPPATRCSTARPWAPARRS